MHRINIYMALLQYKNIKTIFNKKTIFVIKTIFPGTVHSWYLTVIFLPITNKRCPIAFSLSYYRQISNIRCTRSQNSNVSGLVLQLSWCNLLKPGVKSRMKMLLEQNRQVMLHLHLSDQQFFCVLRCLILEALRYVQYHVIFDCVISIVYSIGILIMKRQWWDCRIFFPITVTKYLDTDMVPLVPNITITINPFRADFFRNKEICIGILLNSSMFIWHNQLKFKVKEDKLSNLNVFNAVMAGARASPTHTYPIMNEFSKQVKISDMLDATDSQKS